MRGVACLLFCCLPAVAVGAPSSYTFGGFSPGEREFWKHGADEQVCAPIGASSSQPACRKAERKDVKQFVKPPRSRTAGGVSLSVSIEDEASIVLAAGERRLGVFTPGERVTSVNQNLFVAPSEDLVAVEYESAGKLGKHADVVVFDLSAAPRAPSAPATGAPPAAPAPGGNAYDRATQQGGVWEQRMVPCDQAGVTLTLKKTRTFAIRIATRCQGRKDTSDFGGKWTSEGSDTLVMTFENEDAPMERLVCRFAACEDLPEDCLTCGDEDVSFTMQVVRR